MFSKRTSVHGTHNTSPVTSIHRKTPIKKTKSPNSHHIRHLTTKSRNPLVKNRNISQLSSTIGTDGSNISTEFINRSVNMTPSRSVSMRAVSRLDKNRLRRQKRGRIVFTPSYVTAKDISKRLHITMMQLHKAGSAFFSWWPRASERQMKRDGFSMLSDLVLRFDESAMLCKYLGFKAVYEHTGLDRIRNEHYAFQAHLNKTRALGHTVTPGMRKAYELNQAGRGTGPEPIPDELRVKHIQPKQPVVCVVGHVDHGKTTLLDRLRGSSLAQVEDGKITQDLYSFQCNLGDDVTHGWKTKGGPIASNSVITPGSNSLDNYQEDTLLETYKTVTFLDTPGHASFYDMRENGALFSDVVILVVSAVDGIGPQTLEAIDYVKAFKLPVVVALTKCDLPEANTKAVMSALTEAGLHTVHASDPKAFSSLYEPEKKSGIARRGRPQHQIAPCVDISALTGKNMQSLRDTLMSVFMRTKPQCDVMAPPVGLVLESYSEEGGRGQVLRLLLSSGIVEKNDAFISGIFSGKVKDLRVHGDYTNVVLSDSVQLKLSNANNTNTTSIQSNIDGGDTTTLDASLSQLNLNNNILSTNSESLPAPLHHYPAPRSLDTFDISSHQLGVKKSKVTGGSKAFSVVTRKPKLGEQVQYALPGVPIEVVGLEGPGQSGDDLRVVPSRTLATAIAEVRRLEVEYTNQSRFTSGGLKPTEWTPPPLLFHADYKKDPHVLDKYIDEEAVMNPKRADNDDEIGDVHSDEEEYSDDPDRQGDDVFVDMNKRKKKSSHGDESDMDHYDATKAKMKKYLINSDDDDDGSNSQDSISDDDDYTGSDDDYTGSDDDYTDDDDDSEENSLALPDWNRVHEKSFDYQRPFVIKTATAGGARMILDSVNAFNTKYPDKKIHLVHISVGQLKEDDLTKASSAIDRDLDPDLDCPVLLYRTKQPNAKLMRRAHDMGDIRVYQYSVFDDMLKHMIGTHYYKELFEDSKELMNKAPGSQFAESPEDKPETSESLHVKSSSRRERTKHKTRLAARSGLVSPSSITPIQPKQISNDNNNTNNSTTNTSNDVSTSLVPGSYAARLAERQAQQAQEAQLKKVSGSTTAAAAPPVHHPNGLVTPSSSSSSPSSLTQSSSQAGSQRRSIGLTSIKMVNNVLPPSSTQPSFSERQDQTKM